VKCILEDKLEVVVKDLLQEISFTQNRPQEPSQVSYTVLYPDDDHLLMMMASERRMFKTLNVMTGTSQLIL